MAQWQIQDIIHRFEEGAGPRYLKYGLLCLVCATLMLSYNLRGFKDMSNPEAMDTAQLARNIAQGKGYKTLFVRPFSMFLLKQAYEEDHGKVPLDKRDPDPSQIRGMHPDIANAPLYPMAVAGVMKLFPEVQHQTATSLNGGTKSFWNFGGAFWIYPPDFWISFFNQILFVITVAMVFILAHRWFDPNVAWTSAAIYLGSDIFWKFSIAGLSTMLAILIFLSLAWTLSLLEQKSREAVWGFTRQIFFAAVAGGLLGLAFLTRYSLGWLIIPALLFTLFFLGKYRGWLSLVMLLMFAIVGGVWVAHIYHLSHTLFGTAGFAIFENTAFFPEYRLGRSLDPDLSRVRYDQVWNKLMFNSKNILEEDLLQLGGGWISAFFLVGLLLNFKNRTLNRIRVFLLLCLPFLIAAQALGRTQLSQDSPVVNSENLIILVAPLVIVFGTSLFYILLDQINVPVRQMRSLIVGLFCIVMCLPAIVSLFSPRVTAISYPPYWPPVIQQTTGWMKPDELMMSDIPWGVAWYGQRQCIWLTLNAQKDFFEVSDFRKTVHAVYLTPLTLDSRILSQWVRAAEYSWGSFALDCMLKKELPPNFPLKNAPDKFLPEQLFLTDSERWNDPASFSQR